MFSMKNQNKTDMLITGLGVTSAIGQGKTEFSSALMQGRHAFGVLQRPGRQKETSFLGAEISSLSFPEAFSKRLLRTASFSGQVAMTTLHEAWQEARLDEADGSRIGLVIGGSNIQQRELLQTYEKYNDNLPYLRPNYGLSFMDSDLCGLCTQQFGIHGFSYTLGGASASGLMAILQAIEAVQTGRVDICIAMGALMDLSYMELQALRSLGAMGTDRYAHRPDLACRPFDKNRDGFIFGESCGAVVVEKADTAKKRNVEPYAQVSGWAVGMDGNRNPDPSYEGEVRVIKNALQCAGRSAQEIDYINPHGTGSLIGDEIEIKAIRDCGLSHAFINATKSIVGHGLSAAGAVEVVATLLQMKESRFHPTLNLENPIDASCNWVQDRSIKQSIKHALSLSMGFGGMNTALCLSQCEISKMVSQKV